MDTNVLSTYMTVLVQKEKISNKWLVYNILKAKYKLKFLSFTLNSEKVALPKVLVKYKVWTNKQKFKEINIMP